MTSPDLHPGDHVRLSKPALQAVFDQLTASGYTLAGPTIQDHMICYDQIETTADLPIGWTDEQGPAKYRLHQIESGSYFH